MSTLVYKLICTTGRRVSEFHNYFGFLSIFRHHVKISVRPFHFGMGIDEGIDTGPKKSLGHTDPLYSTMQFFIPIIKALIKTHIDSIANNDRFRTNLDTRY